MPSTTNKRRLDRLSLAILAGILAAATAAACSPDGGNADGGSTLTGGTAGGGVGDGDGDGDQGGGSTESNTVSVNVGPGSGGGDPQGALSISPENPTLDVEYGVAGQTVQFTATRGGQEASGVVWFLSSPEAGTISADGLFTSNGQAGGEITVGAKIDDENATTQLKINLHVVDNPDGITQTDIDILSSPNPGQTDAAWATWYPYDRTVFPRGVPAPAWQFAPSSQQGTAYKLRITGPNIDYEGYYSGAGQQIRPSQGAWDAMGTASDGTDLTVEISKVVGGVKYGPITSIVRIAHGSLKGTIYYNTYDSPLAGTGAIMRIRGNSTTPEVLLGGCVVCHSVAADGSTVAAAQHGASGGTFDLIANPDAPPNVWVDPEMAAFAGLYPEGGQVLVTNGNPGQSWPPNTPGSNGAMTSSLRMRDGTVIPNSGIESYYAQTPVFSNDGTKLAFYSRPAGGGTGVLMIADFDFATKVFTNFITLATPVGGRHLSWPAFTPDGEWVVYQDGAGDDLATWSGNTGVLRAINVNTGTTKTLANLNAEGLTPPPQGARDQNLNYEPTILPVASGGYFWIMFTSRRTFGNTLTGGTGQTKRLWVSAFDLNGEAADPTHPAFYIEGQELASGNSRGFWALDPCRADGEGCESGDQCCNGFCNPSPDDPNVFECGQPDPGSCSDEFESCETAADCCDPDMKCINGRCAEDTPNVPN